MRSKFWCSEEVLSLFFLSVLKRKGYNLILGTAPDRIHLYFSKSELVKAKAKLSPMAVQGRNYIDLVAYDDTRLILGIVLSRIYVIGFGNGLEHLRKILQLFIAVPSKAEEAYRELKEWGYDISSTNIAKLYKILVVSRVISKVARIYDKIERLVTLVIVPCLAVDRVRDTISSFVESLLEFVAIEHGIGREMKYALICFKPKELTKISPSIVSICHVQGSDEVFSSCEDVAFAEVMGFDYSGCLRCKYMSVCSKEFGR